MDAETTPVAPGTHERTRLPAREVTATIACHPDLRRIGEMATFDDRALAVGISRHAPRFGQSPDAGEALADRFVSRTPTRFLRRGADLEVRVAGRVEREGRPLPDGALLSAAELARGVWLTLGERVALFLREAPQAAWGVLPEVGGTSPAIRRVHEAVLRMSRLDGAVLVTGPVGSRREAVCQAIHRRSSRADGPFVATRLLPDTSIPALLDRARRGTLVLVEPAGVPLALLQAIEAGDPAAPRILVIAESPDALAVELRTRFPDHVALPSRLPVEDGIAHFGSALVERLVELGRDGLIERESPWLSPEDVMALPAEPDGGWRAIAAFAHRIAVESPDAHAVLPAPPTAPSLEAERDALIQLLEPHRYRISVAARAAGISPNTLRRRMHEAGMAVASELTDAQVRAAERRTGGDVEAMARELRVSVHGLRIRWAELKG